MNLWLPLKVVVYSKVLVAQHTLSYFMNKYEKTVASASGIKGMDHIKGAS